MEKNNRKTQSEYGLVSTAADLGHLMRGHRKSQQLTLEKVSGLSNLSMRFLSELERGKETAELGKALTVLANLGLEVIIQPRGRQQHVEQQLKKFDIKDDKDE